MGKHCVFPLMSRTNISSNASYSIFLYLWLFNTEKHTLKLYFIFKGYKFYFRRIRSKQKQGHLVHLLSREQQRYTTYKMEKEEMSEKPRKVAIIGAGPVALMFLKIFTDKGHQVTCFEKQSKVGGMWNVHGENENGYAELGSDGSNNSVYRCCQFNGSKFTECASYDQPDDSQLDADKQFLHRQDYLEWIERSCSKFNLEKYVRFNTEVKKLERDNLSGEWIIVSHKVEKDNTDDSSNYATRERFDFVVSCIGYSYPKMPQIPNINMFKGIAIHSSQVRSEAKLFPNKRVVVIGGSYSGTDMVYWALKHNATKVYWNIGKENSQKSYWMFDRYSNDVPAKPFDLYPNRYNCYDRQDILGKVMSSLAKPLHKAKDDAMMTVPGDQFSVVDYQFIFDNIKSQNIVKIPSVKSVVENRVNCTDDSAIEDVDVLIFGTGFQNRYPWIDHLLSAEEQEDIERWCHMLPVKRELQGLAIIGGLDIIGSFIPVYENQARWLSKFWLPRCRNNTGDVFTEKELANMLRSTQLYKESRPKNLRFNFCHEYFKMSDSLAKDLGCLPPDYKQLIINRTSKEDVELGIALMKGPISNSIQYRIEGDDSFPDAAKILIDIAKYLLGEEEFQKSVKLAMEDPNDFLKINGIEHFETFEPEAFMKPFLDIDGY